MQCSDVSMRCFGLLITRCSIIYVFKHFHINCLNTLTHNNIRQIHEPVQHTCTQKQS